MLSSETLKLATEQPVYSPSTGDELVTLRNNAPWWCQTVIHESLLVVLHACYRAQNSSAQLRPQTMIAKGIVNTIDEWRFTQYVIDIV